MHSLKTTLMIIPVIIIDVRTELIGSTHRTHITDSTWPCGFSSVSYTKLADCLCNSLQSGRGCNYSQLGYPSVKLE